MASETKLNVLIPDFVAWFNAWCMANQKRISTARDFDIAHDAARAAWNTWAKRSVN